MRHRLTDLDYAVLAAARIGALRREGQVWTINGQTAMPSLFRLEQAGEVYISLKGDLLIPGTDEYHAAEAREELIVTIRRGWRDGSIEIVTDSKGHRSLVMKPTKGTKP